MSFPAARPGEKLILCLLSFSSSGRRPNGLRVSRAATLPKCASTRSTSHNRFSPRYQTAKRCRLHALVRFAGASLSLPTCPDQVTSSDHPDTLLTIFARLSSWKQSSILTVQHPRKCIEPVSGRQATSVHFSVPICGFYEELLLPQHCLYFFPLPHGQGSFRLTLSDLAGCCGFNSLSKSDISSGLSRSNPMM